MITNTMITNAVKHLANVANAIGDEWWALRLEGLLLQRAEQFDTYPNDKDTP